MIVADVGEFSVGDFGGSDIAKIADFRIDRLAFLTITDRAADHVLLEID
jgi:hypothetical protein